MFFFEFFCLSVFFFFARENVPCVSGCEYGVGADGEAKGYSKQALTQFFDPQQKGMSCHCGRNLTVVFVECFVARVCVHEASVLNTALCWIDNINLLGKDRPIFAIFTPLFMGIASIDTRRCCRSAWKPQELTKSSMSTSPG